MRKNQQHNNEVNKMAKYLRRYPAPLIWFLVICIVILLAAITLISLWAAHLQQELVSMDRQVQSLQEQLAALETAPTEPPATEPVTEPVPTTMPPEPTEEPTLPALEDQPAELTAILELENITYDMLAEKQCAQLVTVESMGNKATLRMFTCDNGLWQELPDLNCPGFVGRNGSSVDKREGDGCSPVGLYSIGSGFYIDDVPETGLDLFQVTEDTYWVDDSNSQFYNQRVEGTANKDWRSAEHMIDYPEYLYGFVVNFNMPVVKAAGSAIFFHINDTPTAGCIATTEQMVLAYLAQLDKEQYPHILIVNV